MTMPRPLNEVMGFDHVIVVDECGNVTDSDRYAPSCYVDLDSDGSAIGEPYVDSDKWVLLTGFTGQYGYNGATMHRSEFIDGGLERHILENPGEYVALVAYPLCDNKEHEDPDGWVIAYRRPASRMTTPLDRDYPVYVPARDTTADSDGAHILESTFKALCDNASEISGHHGLFSSGTIGCDRCHGPIVTLRVENPVLTVHPSIGHNGTVLCGNCTHINILFLNFTDNTQRM